MQITVTCKGCAVTQYILVMRWSKLGKSTFECDLDFKIVNVLTLTINQLFQVRSKDY